MLHDFQEQFNVHPTGRREELNLRFQLESSQLYVAYAMSVARSGPLEI